MAVGAVLAIDGGASLNEGTFFETKPEVGEIIRYWKNGREPSEARVVRIAHLQMEDGFRLVVEAESIELIR